VVDGDVHYRPSLLPTIEPSELLFVGEHRKGDGDGAYGTIFGKTSMWGVVVKVNYPIHHPCRRLVAIADVFVTGLDGKR
jgi:hypothetical protein